MVDEFQISNYFQSGQPGKWMIENPSMWQMDLLDERQFATFIRDKGIANFYEKDIRLLWKLRLLKADLVISTRKLATKGLIEYKVDDQNQRIYADARQPLIRKSGLGNSAIGLKEPGGWIKLHFHPFRYFVMYHLNRVLKFSVSPIQMLRSDYFQRATEIIVPQFNKSTGTHEFQKTINRWNDVAALSIAAEPWAYEKVFHTLRYHPPYIEEDDQRHRIIHHFTELNKLFQEIGLKKIEKIRQKLCCNAEFLDPNKNLHMLIRLMKPDKHLKLKGHIGGSMTIIAMAEMLRRVAEEVFNIKLPEEDEKGFGWTPPDLKKNLYGKNRLLDRNRPAANEFIRQFGLDYGVKVRCYIEGETECAALESVFDPHGAIELINLGGNVAQKRGKGVAFRESLRSDIDKGIYSFVLIDNDRSDYARAVKKASEDDEISGMFLFSNPDIEFGNFTVTDFEKILWDVLKEKRLLNPENKKKLRKAISGVSSGEDLKDAVKGQFLELSHFNKGKQWGRRLMDFAWHNPDIEINGINKRRPILEFIDYIVKATEVQYHYNRCRYRTDPNTGRHIPRE